MNNDVSSKNLRFQTILNRARVDDRIIALCVFGSYLKQQNYHDIDICLFTKKDGPNDGIIQEYLGNSEEIFDIKIFHKLPLYIQIEVLNDGKILLLKDYDTLLRVFLKTIKEWNLFEPHFKAYLEAVQHG
jgi:Polymerase beta, Nucleotidyltransferase